MTVLEQRFMQQVPNLLHDIAENLKIIAGKLTAEKPKYVWVFTAEQTCDYECLDIIVETFGDEETAQKYLHDFVYNGEDTIADMVTGKGWEVELDEPDIYRASGDSYSKEHVELTITRCEIK